MFYWKEYWKEQLEGTTPRRQHKEKVKECLGTEEMPILFT